MVFVFSIGKIRINALGNWFTVFNVSWKIPEKKIIKSSFNDCPFPIFSI